MSSAGPRLNPFQPDHPARASIFTGRIAERDLIRGTLVDTLRGRAAHVLIVGERGMGKTSLARYVAGLAQDPEVADAAGGVPPPVVLFVSLGFSASVEDLCAAVLSEAYRWARTRAPLTQWFREEVARIEGLELGVFGLSVKAHRGAAAALPLAFPDAIETFLQRAADVGGLVVILDETEAIADDRAFPSFMKGLTETLSHRGIGNVQFVITATPEGRDRMTANHASFPRLFRHVHVGTLSDREVVDLVRRALAEGLPRKKAEREFEDAMVHNASGIPSFVHEIGRAAFEVDDDDLLTSEDFKDGVLGTDRVVGALAMLEQKHFQERYSRKILSNTYREILHAIANVESDEVTVEEVREACPGIAQVAPYLANMAKRGVVVRVEGKKGVYRLPDRMFGVFLRIQSRKSRLRRPRNGRG